MTACEKYIDIQDGKIPDQYLSIVKETEGAYSVVSNGNPFDLNISIENDNSVKIETAKDLLDVYCHSKILGLLEIGIYKEKLDSATFGFDPGLCSNQIEGRTFHVSFGYTGDHQFGFRYSIFQYLRPETVCYWQTDIYGHSQYVCHTEWRTSYLRGRAVQKSGTLSETLKAFLLPLDAPWREDVTAERRIPIDFRGRR